MNIGEKIKRLRRFNGLTQDELATRCELSKGFISQVERDLTSPSISTLVDMLESLGTNLRDFFNEEEEEKIVFQKEDVFVTEDEDMGYELHWVVPNAQKNTMEPILLTLDPQGAYRELPPYEGEEFGYVLSGAVLLDYGGQKLKAKKGESFYLKADKAHSLRNAGKSKAVVLWISSPPNF